MRLYEGCIVKRGPREDEAYIVLSLADSLMEGEKALLRRIGHSPRTDVGFVSTEELEPLTSESMPIGDALSHLVIQSLYRHVGKRGISMRAGATIFEPFQFRPLLSYLDGSRKRILIADEVGLGKTISACYILVEEMARKPMDRVVVVCPSHLKRKWRSELWRRFGLHFNIMGGKRFLNALQGNDRLRCIISMDSMSGRMPIFRDISSQVKPIDMLLVDEAHHLIGRSGMTQRREFVQSLSLLSSRAVGLTATPIQLELNDLKRVLDIIDPKEWSEKEFMKEMRAQASLNKLFQSLGKSEWEKRDGDATLIHCDETISSAEEIGKEELIHALRLLSQEIKSSDLSDIKVRGGIREKVRTLSPMRGRLTRTRRIETSEGLRKREPITIRVKLDTTTMAAVQSGKKVSVSEQSLFQEMDLLLKESFSHVHRRQLASCLPAMAKLLESGMEGFNVWTDGRSRITDEDHTLLEEGESNKWDVLRPTLSDDDKKRCQELADHYFLRAVDSKFDRMMEVLRTLRDKGQIRKAIVFTQWRPTIEHLRNEALRSLSDVKHFIITGDDQEERREEMIRRFQSYEGFAVLFSADVISEGLDLQSADCIVNYDLPYNPQKIEQRIGRIDRIGQVSQTLTILNILVEGSTDEAVHDTLLSRINVFKEYIGDVPATLEDALVSGDTIDQDNIIREAARIAEIKRLQEHDALVGLDEVLDERTLEIHRKKRCEMGAYRHLVLRDLFNLLLGEGAGTVPSSSEGLVMVKGINNEDARAIASLLPIEVTSEVQWRLSGLASGRGHRSLSIDPRASSWYLPLLHPLMSAGVRIVHDYLYSDPENMPVEFVNIDQGAITSSDISKLVLITEHNVEFGSTNHTDWNYWSLITDEPVSRIVDESTKEEMLSSLCGLPSRMVPSEVAMESLPVAVIESIDKCHGKWMTEMEKEARARDAEMLESRLERLHMMKGWKERHQEKMKQDGRVQPGSDKAIRSLSRSCEELEKRIEIIRNDYSGQGCDSRWRIVAIMRGE